MAELRTRVLALFAWIGRAGTALVGLATLIVALAVLASLPLIQLLALAYLLAAGAAVARSGRLREGLSWRELGEAAPRGEGANTGSLERLARVGSVALGAWLLLWIPRLFASLADSARLIDPGSARARVLDGVALGLVALLCLHLIAAIARGARLRHVLIPRPRRELEALRLALSREGYRRAREAVWAALSRLRARRLLRLALLGLLTGVVWLLVPTSLLALGSDKPALAVLGCLLLAWVVAHLPFLQLHVAVEGRLGAIMERERIVAAHARAPLAMAGALALTLLAALPLYLLKIELIPREALWLPGLLFVASMLPARLVCGLALHYARTRERPRGRGLRALGWLLRAAVVSVYALGLYFTQYLSWYGTWSLYEQHAFLLPVPFLGL